MAGVRMGVTRNLVALFQEEETGEGDGGLTREHPFQGMVRVGMVKQGPDLSFDPVRHVDLTCLAIQIRQEDSPKKPNDTGGRVTLRPHFRKFLENVYGLACLSGCLVETSYLKQNQRLAKSVGDSII
jgi:hypothetical protein